MWGTEVMLVYLSGQEVFHLDSEHVMISATLHILDVSNGSIVIGF